MKNTFKPIFLTSLVLALGSHAASFAQGAPAVRIRGEIVQVRQDAVLVKRRNGEKITVTLKPGQTVSAVTEVPLSAIRQGDFVGTATRNAPDGSLVALEVLVFPEAARGTGEGHYEWDLLPGSTMTNANVDAVAAGVAGRELSLSYKGGTQKVTVPPEVPVVTVVPARLEDLKPGKKVFIVAQGEPSAPSAVRIIVEKDGVVPPM